MSGGSPKVTQCGRAAPFILYTYETIHKDISLLAFGDRKVAQEAWLAGPSA